MNYCEAAAFLGSLPPFVPMRTAPGEDLFNLDKIRILLGMLGNPETKTRFVHVAGSNGKGSVSAFLQNILTEAGYRTGLYTSPSLVRLTERIRIGREEISGEDFARLTERIREESVKMDAAGQGFPSEFEILTAAAFLFFSEEHCDIAVLETGLGGRLDATNVIPAPLLSVITPISLEHTQVLGDTLAEIAREKAGIIKSGPETEVLLAPQPEEARDVILRVCEARGVPSRDALLPLSGPGPSESRDLRTREFSVLIGGVRKTFRIGMVAPYQTGNACTALTAALILREKGFRIPDEALSRGLAGTRWPGRFEIFNGNPVMIVDGSHNPAGAETLGAALAAHFPGREVTFVAGILADKSWTGMIDRMLPLGRHFYAITPDSPRALPAAVLAEYVRGKGGIAEVCPDALSAVRAAVRTAGDGGVVCAFGSLYSVGALREAALLVRG